MLLTIAILALIAAATAYAALRPGGTYATGQGHMSEQWLAEHRAQDGLQS